MPERFVVQTTPGDNKFATDNPVDVVIDERQHIAMSWVDAYKLARDLLAQLYADRQITNYRISTKPYSHLNDVLTKNW